MKMNKELEVFATTLNQFVKNIPDGFTLHYIWTTDIVEKLIEENKEYEYIYDEDDEIQEKKFKGYKDANLHKNLEKIYKSLKKDEENRKSDRDEFDTKVLDNVKAIKKLLKIYAINTEEDK